MARPILSRLSYANVMATIAVFMALGGGYAIAFSGSGTLQKGKQVGIDGSFEDLRSLNGFGTLQVRCDSPEDEVEYRVRDVVSANTEFRAWQESNTAASPTNDVVDNVGDESDTHSTESIASTTGMHLYKQGTGKAGVDIIASHRGPVADFCSTAEVQVMALNTVE